MMTTEFKICRIRRGVCQAEHGPYHSQEEAQHRKEVIEEIHGDTWVIMEREVTPWTAIPMFPPGDMGQLND